MKILPALFKNNREWAENISRQNPNFFAALARQQTPEFLWIGCADSRVPANEITGLLPGELFVHRNVANLVTHTDLNCLSVLQYAVETLKVRHIIVCGHYGCGGVRAALDPTPHGLIDNWLRPIWSLGRRHAAELALLSGLDAQADRLCEINVIDQVKNVAHTTVVQEAWRRGQPVSVHGWIYAITDGLLQDLDACISSPEDLRALEER